MSADGTYYSACDACRARKYKCTKEKPSCTPCQHLGVECKYSPKATRTALTRDNLNAAEARIRDLEAAFATLIPGIDLEAVLSTVHQDGLSTDENVKESGGKRSSTVVKQEQDKATPTPEPEAVPRQADGFDWSESAVSVDDLADGMAALSVNPEGAGYLGATSHVVSLRALLGKDQGIDQAASTSTRWSRPILDTSLSSFALQNFSEGYLLDAYFSHYHLTYPFIYEPTFRDQLNGILPRPPGHTWALLYNAVLTLGAWCIGDDDSMLDDIFYRRAAQISAENSAFESGNLTTVQALLLLSNYAQKRNRPNTGWNYLGLAVRMAMSLGLHKEFPNWDISLLQREIRRRVWWGVYCFDAGASITFGRPVLLPDPGVMDAEEVLNIHDESLISTTVHAPVDAGVATLYSSLITQSQFHALTTPIHHRLISHPDPTPAELLVMQNIINDWEHTIPAYFQTSNSKLRASFPLYFARHRLSWRVENLKIVLFRPVVLRWAARKWSTTNGTSDQSFTESSEEEQCRTRCLESASLTIKSVAEFANTSAGTRLSTWYMLYFLFQAGLIPTIALMSDPLHSDASKWLADVLTTKDLLQTTATYNRLAARCLAVLERLCAPIFGVAQPMDILQNPQVLTESFDFYANMNQNDFQLNRMEFWNLHDGNVQWPI